MIQKFAPDTVVHYAEQPSAPYSMIGYEEARSTLSNNLLATFSLIWAVIRHAPECHIIKLGTMGEYGTPNIDIEEGWIEINAQRAQRQIPVPAPGRQPLSHDQGARHRPAYGSTCGSMDLRVTDLMQGPVYGLSTDEADLDSGCCRISITTTFSVLL